MRVAGRTTDRRQPVLPGVLGALVAAWGLVLAASLEGRAGWFGHGVLEAPGWASLAIAVVAWEIMTVAMMGPSCLPVARYVAANTLAPGRTVPLFLTAYLAPWTAFFAAFALVDAIAHGAAAGAPAGAPALPLAAMAFTAAAGWQLTGAKAERLRACRTVGVLPAHGRRAGAASARLGLRQGVNCVGSCGPLMLATLAATTGRLALMALVAGLAWLEKATRLGRRLARPSAAALLVIAVASVAAGGLRPAA